ncbi:VanZ family protein [Nocardioides sp. zg-1308]|uniref:VanZ family protein n=1 Tax=Nocardioides sp. zg-1308 TaxID=2736253 RepID=UPI0015518219|nr:VanZ family protein [Nocardioides sp. zg-1308]NPD04380.1 VanZ family protein [Nocardioides sp. zg-1308]
MSVLADEAGTHAGRDDVRVIATVLVEHRWLTTTALVLLVVLGPAVGYWLTDRPRLAGAAALLSLVPVAALTLVPTSRDLAVGCAVEWATPSLGAVEPMANLVLFVPPALFLGVALRRPIAVLVGASAVSALIELAQAFLTGLGRSCSTNDWLSNTLGAALGAGLAVAALWLRSYVDRSRESSDRATVDARV